MKVLIVDDDLFTLNLLQITLEKMGHTVVSASSGVEAIETLRRDDIRQMITDWEMPEMNGVDLCRTVRSDEINGYVYVIMLSGRGDAKSRREGLSAGADDFLYKPLDQDDLLVCFKTAERVLALETRDVALFVKLMQLVNSAFFAVSLRIANPSAAVVLLGVKTLHAIVVADPLFECSSVNGNELPGLSALWKSSFEIGKAAGQLARSDGASEIVQEQSRLAGLLSSIGRGVLLTSDPAAYAGLVADCQANPKTLRQREIDFFGASQDEVTAYAIGLWSFADEVVDAVAYQSAPSRMPAIIRQHPATYLHIARNVRTVSSNPLEETDGLDQPLIERLNLHTLVPRRSRYAA